MNLYNNVLNKSTIQIKTVLIYVNINVPQTVGKTKKNRLLNYLSQNKSNNIGTSIVKKNLDDSCNVVTSVQQYKDLVIFVYIMVTVGNNACWKTIPSIHS